MRTKAKCALLAAALTAALAAAAPSPASAYSGCWSGGPSVELQPGLTLGTKWCHNYRSYRLRWQGVTTGHLYAGNNWFVCQRPGGANPAVGSARNNWWLFTQGDIGYAHRGWGWFPATMVSGGGNYAPIPGLRSCDSQDPGF